VEFGRRRVDDIRSILHARTRLPSIASPDLDTRMSQGHQQDLASSAIGALR
jgi:hypothetical protein